MKVKSIILDSTAVGNLENIIGSDPSCIVVKAPAKAQQLFRDAVDAQLGFSQETGAKYTALKAYFVSLYNNADFAEAVDESLESTRSYLSEGMAFRVDYNSIMDYVMARCVRLCALLVSKKTGAVLLDGARLVSCREENGQTVIDWKTSDDNIRKSIPQDRLSVVSAGYGMSAQGYTVNIARGGADLMATAIASVLDAPEIVFYATDDRIPSVSELSYDEAAHFFSGDEAAIFPPAMWPAVKKDIPIVVSSVSLTEGVRTVISRSAAPQGSGCITGVVCDREMDLITVYGTGLLGSVGISSALFGLMAKEGINIRFISQSSQEYSISFAIRHNDSGKAVEAIKANLSDNHLLSINDLMVLNQKVCIVSVFGDRMKNVPGVSAKVYAALGAAGISIVAASQGGEELSISIVVRDEEAEDAVEALQALL